MAPTSMAKIAAGQYVERLEAENARLRAAFRINAIRDHPELSHDEIDADIDRIVRGDEQSAPSRCKTCNDTGEIDGPPDIATYTLPCPDCDAEPLEQRGMK